MRLLSILITTILGLPNGAPRCSISKFSIGLGHFSFPSSLGYNIAFNPIQPNEFSVNVSNSARKYFQGLLMYVSPMNDESTHLGKFTFQDQTKWKYQLLDLCKDGDIKGDQMGTLTHANNQLVKTNEELFRFRVDDGGDLMLHAVVASSEEGKVGGRPEWQVIRQVLRLGQSSSSQVGQTGATARGQNERGTQIPSETNGNGTIGIQTASDDTFTTDLSLPTVVSSAFRAVNKMWWMVAIWVV